MHDVGKRLEIGTLDFSSINNSTASAQLIALPEEFSNYFSIRKMLMRSMENVFESGLLLEANDKQICIVAGAFPFTLAVRISGIELPSFESECPFEAYELEAV